MEHVLQAIEPVRAQVGRIGVGGQGWEARPRGAGRRGIADVYYTDQAYLRGMGVEFHQPVPFEEVIPWMSRAVINPVIYRPLFSRLRLVTCRTFETPAAGTIPLFGLERAYVRDIFGHDADALVLPDEHAAAQISGIMRDPA